MSKFLNISTDNTLGGNSAADDVVSSQKAIKDYIDGHSGTWGSITGTLSNQTDLQNALDAKQDEISQQTSAPSNPSDGDLWIDTDETPGGSINLSDLGDTTITTPTNGQVLTYDNSTSKWVNSNIPTELPSITGNANKILSVNAGATGVEWITNSGGGASVPTPTLADAGKLLSVDSNGDYVLVTIVNSENVAY